jgi:hypothetical protein
MLLKFLEGKYLVRPRIEECPSLVQQGLNEAGLKNVVVKKEVPPRYLLVAYTPGWVGKAMEIEFVFNERDAGTEILVKWPYAKEIQRDDESLSEFRELQEERRHMAECLIE